MKCHSCDSVNKQTEFEWEIDVPIFRGRIILSQLALAIGLPFGLLGIILIISTGGKILNIYGLYAAGLVGTLFLLTYIFIMIVYKGKYAAGFVIDDKGIICYTQKRQAKYNRIINGLTVVLGLLSGKPAAAGAGLLAQSRQSVLIKWKNIQKVKLYPKTKTIMVSGGFTEKIAVYCTAENYSEVESLIKSKVSLIPI
jgi:hypothetical protein